MINQFLKLFWMLFQWLWLQSWFVLSIREAHSWLLVGQFDVIKRKLAISNLFCAVEASDWGSGSFCCILLVNCFFLAYLNVVVLTKSEYKLTQPSPHSHGILIHHKLDHSLQAYLLYPFIIREEQLLTYLLKAVEVQLWKIRHQKVLIWLANHIFKQRLDKESVSWFFYSVDDLGLECYLLCYWDVCR